MGGRSQTLILLAVGLACMGSICHAAPVTFFGEDLNFTDPPGGGDDPVRPVELPNSDAAREAFEAKLVSVIFSESFESFPNGAVPTTLPFSGLGASVIGANEQIVRIPAGTYAGTFPISGEAFLFDWNSTGVFTIAFPSPHTAFGFYATDVGDGLGQLSVTLSLAGGGTEVFQVPHTNPSGTGSALYFGVISDPFTSVTLSNNRAWWDGFGYDDMIVGRAAAAIPLPGAVVLCMMGTGLVGWMRRRRAL